MSYYCRYGKCVIGFHMIIVWHCLDIFLDDLSEIICSDSSLLALISAGTKRPSYKEKDSQDIVLKKIFDSLVVFTSNGMEHISFSS